MADVNARSLTRNAFYAGVLQVWTIASRFIITPLVIAKLGLAGYGTWTLLFGICAYVSMFDTSFAFAYSKFTAEYDRRREYDKLSSLIGSGIALIGSVGLLGVVLIWVWRYPLLQILNVPADLIGDASIALLIVSSCLLLRMSFGSVFQILEGLQRIDLKYKLNMLASAVEFGIALLLLSIGYGLLGLALGHLCGQVVGTIGGRILCWRLCPSLHISPFRASRAGLHEIASLGGRFQLLGFIVTGFQQGFRMILSAVCGTDAVGLFELASKILGLGSTAGHAVIAPMMPAFSHIHADSSDPRKNILFMSGSRVLAAVCVVSLSLLAIFADVIIRVWTGSDYPLAAWTVRLIVFGYYLNLLTGVITSSLRARGSIRLETWCAVIGSFCMFTLLLPAIRSASYPAFVLAYASGIIGTIWLFVMYARQESIPVLKYFLDFVLRPVAIVLPVIGLAIGLRHLYQPHPFLLTGRMGLAVYLALWGGSLAVLMGVLLWYGMLSYRERQAISDLLRFRYRRPDASWQNGIIPPPGLLGSEKEGS